MFKIKYIGSFLLILLLISCNKFEEFNTNPNEPTEVSTDVLLPSSIRQSVNTTVDASFLIGNNAAQLTAKTLRLEVDAYNWNAFPKYWEGWYQSLTDLKSIEKIAILNGNDVLEGVVIVLRSWIFENLTNSYGYVPYSEATLGDEGNFTPIYDSQEFIYRDLLLELEKANILLAGEGSIEGDILLGGDTEKWQKFCNSLRLRLLMYAGNKIATANTQFANIVTTQPIISSNNDNVELVYTGSFPNEFPLIPLKAGDFDAVALSQTALNVLQEYNDPRLARYARPNNDDFDAPTDFVGAINGQGDASCSKDGASRLGVQYYNYPNLTQTSNLGLNNANGIIMTYAEIEFLLAEAIQKGWITGDIETHYKNGIAASMEYHQVDPVPFGYSDFEDYYATSGVAYQVATDIWEQKWLALFFHGLEPYFELRRWYTESGNSFDGLPFIEAACQNLNNNKLPLRFLYPTEEESLNAANCQAAIDAIGGSDDQNIPMWLLQL